MGLRIRQRDDGDVCAGNPDVAGVFVVSLWVAGVWLEGCGVGLGVGLAEGWDCAALELEGWVTGCGFHAGVDDMGP